MQIKECPCRAETQRQSFWGKSDPVSPQSTGSGRIALRWHRIFALQLGAWGKKGSSLSILHGLSHHILRGGRREGETHQKLIETCHPSMAFFLHDKLPCFPLCRKQHVGNSGASNTFYWKQGCFCNGERNVLEYEVIKQLDKFRCAKSPGINICLACFYVPTARVAYPLLSEM